MNRYSDELNRRLVSLGHAPDPGELWQAHRIAATLASNDVFFRLPDLPSEMIVMTERVVVADMLGSLGIDEKTFYMHMINASIEAKNSGDMNLTTPFGLWVLENTVNE